MNLTNIAELIALSYPAPHTPYFTQVLETTLPAKTITCCLKFGPLSRACMLTPLADADVSSLIQVR